MKAPEQALLIDGRPRRPVHKAPAPGRNDHARADPARSSSAAAGRRTHCTELLQPEDPLCYPCPSSGASTRSQRPPFFRPFQFFDHTRLNHGALCIFAVQLVLIRSEPGICQLAHRWSANQFPLAASYLIAHANVSSGSITSFRGSERGAATNRGTVHQAPYPDSIRCGCETSSRAPTG
jgi:hypothetical protein